MSSLGEIEQSIARLNRYREPYTHGPNWEIEPGSGGPFYCVSGNVEVPPEECHSRYAIITEFNAQIQKLERQREVLIQAQKPAST